MTFHSHATASHLILKALYITLVFMVIEFLGGWFSNSLALFSDALHMLTDAGAMTLSLFSIWISRRPSTPSMSYGYHRAEILGALTSGLLIWLISGILIYESILRLQSPPPVNGPIVLIIATIGLLSNFISMYLLHSQRNSNMNVRATYIHLLADSIGSIGAILSGIILWLTQWEAIDPIISILFALLMLGSSFSLVKDAVSVLMQSTPKYLDVQQIKKQLETIPSIKEAHDLHIWAISSNHLTLSVHLISENTHNNPTKDILEKANHLLEMNYGITHTTIQVENPDFTQSKHCYDCTPLES